MDREPRISEIEKLIKHFRDTNREHELLEVLHRHGIRKDESVPVIDEATHEYHQEGIVLNKIAQREGFLKKSNKFVVATVNAYKERWYLRYGLYYLVIFLAIFGLLNAPVLISQFTFKEKQASSKVITVQELQETPMADSAPIADGEIIPSGSQLVVPKINVKTPIIYVETTNEASIQAALPNGVVHYHGTAKPGEVGNTFITGHSSNYWWIKGQYNYVFLHLNKIEIGDQAIIYRDGKKFVYQASNIKVVEPNETSVLNPTDTPVLTLMTCTPPGTNWKRLIVTMDQISPKYTKPVLVSREVTVPEEIALPGDSNTLGAIWTNIVNFITRPFRG
jgi:LPXTG-site transpeptidase (sortase) family protein